MRGPLNLVATCVLNRAYKTSLLEATAMGNLKAHINTFMAKLGYQIRRLPKEGEEAQLEFSHLLARRYLESDDFFFIQIGAHDGVKFDGLYDFVTTHECRGIVVEPVGDYFRELVTNYAGHPRIVPVNKGIHATESRITIHRISPEHESTLPDWARGSASIFPTNLERYEFPKECVIQETVDCITLTQLFEMHAVKHVDLLQIDVEGYDFELLKLIEFRVIKPKLIKFEHRSLTAKDQTSARELLLVNGYSLWNDLEDTVAVLAE